MLWNQYPRVYTSRTNWHAMSDRSFSVVPSLFAHIHSTHKCVSHCASRGKALPPWIAIEEPAPRVSRWPLSTGGSFPNPSSLYRNFYHSLTWTVFRTRCLLLCRLCQHVRVLLHARSSLRRRGRLSTNRRDCILSSYYLEKVHDDALLSVRIRGSFNVGLMCGPLVSRLRRFCARNLYWRRANAIEIELMRAILIAEFWYWTVFR